jgi:hypothetical protein
VEFYGLTVDRSTALLGKGIKERRDKEMMSIMSITDEIWV